jgi:serine phosphatase RsbU (regulator of sigma subunit)
VPSSGYPPVRPMLRAGRWAILLALAAALLFGHRHLDAPGVRPGLGIALLLYALASAVVLRAPSLSGLRVTGIMAADLLFTTVVVEASGGLRSPFFGLYYLIVVACAIFYNLPGGLVAAVAIAGITLLVEKLGLHGPLAPPVVMIETLPELVLVAVVAGYLTGQLRHETEARHEAEREALQLEMNRQSLEREMALARRVQQAALPRTSPQVPGLDVGVRFQSAAEVGGDFYDFQEDGNWLGLVVGDAAGKGVPAALVATSATHSFHTQAPGGRLAEWCASFSRELEQRAPDDMLATAFCCRVDGGSGRGTWVNAGHPPPVLCRAGGEPTLLTEHDLVLGMLSDAPYTERELTLAPGDVLVIYTDGLTEAVCRDGSLAGVEPLLRWLPALVEMEAEAIARGIEARLREVATLRDDLTLLVLKKVAPGT